MIDTTTVNYAIDKIATAWHGIAPQVNNISEKYIDYVVIQRILEFPILLVMSMFSVILLKFFINKVDDWDLGAVVGIAVSACVFVLTLFGSFFSLYYMLLALWCPEMFAIHEFIKMAK